MNDLTWAELLAALPPEAVFVDAGRGVCLNVSLVSGEPSTLNQLTAIGVIEFCYKLLDAGNRAQTTKNATLPVGSKLNSFSNPTWGTPNLNGFAVARHTVAAQFSVNMAVATAPIA